VEPGQPLNRFVPRWARRDAALWRHLVEAGVQYGPEAFVRYSPPAIGLGFWAALRPSRDKVLANLRRVRGPHPATGAAATLDAARDVVTSGKVFANFASCLADTFLVSAGRGYQAIVQSENNGADFFAAQADGRGIILATAHTAGWDVAGPMLTTLQSAEIVVVMGREEDARARALHDRARERAGVRVVHAGDDPLAALPLLAHLRRKGIVAMKMDRTVPGMRCRTVDLFGQPWKVPEGILTLSAVSGAPILPVFTRRIGFLHYEYLSSPALRLPRRPSGEELDRSAQDLADRLAGFVRDHPDQWFSWEA
jgi:lauroyl/myristoyl acyltransferase